MPEQSGSNQEYYPALRLDRMSRSDRAEGRKEVAGMGFRKEQKLPDVPTIPASEAREIIQDFETEVARQEDILYGVALFFEGVSVLNADQEEILEVYRDQFRNVIQTARSAIDQATALLEQAKKNPGTAGMLRDFRFSPCQGHADPEELTKRARIMVLVYEELFPGRSRSEPFTEADGFKLMESAADKLA